MKKLKASKNNGSSNVTASTSTPSTGEPSSISQEEDNPLFFFKPNEPHGEFCQWYPATFTVNKAEMSTLVGHATDEADSEGWNPRLLPLRRAIHDVLQSWSVPRQRDTEADNGNPGPKEQRRLGRLTRGFSHTSWDEIKSDVVVAGNWAKFSQNPRLKGPLLDTRRSLLAETASLDRVWGIG